MSHILCILNTITWCSCVNANFYLYMNTQQLFINVYTIDAAY